MVVMVIVPMVVMGASRMGMSAMRVVVMMFDRIAARVARMRPEDRDQAGQNGAQQRQKDDCLNHQSILGISRQPIGLVRKTGFHFSGSCALSPSSD